MNHQHERQTTGMMWLMMGACALPIIITSVVGIRSGSAWFWVVIGLGLMYFLHWIAMRHHRRSPDRQENKTNNIADRSHTATDNHPH